MSSDNISLLTRSASSAFALVEQQAKDIFYYQPAWLDLIADVYGHTITPLTTTDAAGNVTGFLPVCSIASPMIGRRLVSLPFSDHCPLLAIDDASAAALVEQALELARQHKVKYLELRTGSSDVLAGRRDFVRGDLYVRWLLSLAPDPDAMWSGLRKPVQRQLRKAQKLGVQVRVAQERADVAHYYRLHLQTRSKKHGMPSQPQRYFYRLWDAFAASGGMKLLLAEYEGAVIAGMILLASDKMLRYAYGASDERYLHLAPNNLLLWTAITLGCEQGLTTLDLGRTARDNEGLMEFKRRWGAVQEPLPYYYYPHVEGLASTSEKSLKFRLLTGCWKRLPVRISGPVGGIFYRHMA
jgi:FemAB-related protein (PEP-CTERM system-associated)